MSAWEAGGASSDERDRIVRAFVELVADHGYEAVDLSIAGARAGVGSDVTRRHFADRLECFITAWDELESAYMGQVLLACENAEGWRDRLRAAAWHTTQLVESRPKEARFLIVEAFAAGRRGRERQQALARRLSTLLGHALGDLHQSDGDSVGTPGWTVGIFFHHFYSCLIGRRAPQASAEIPRLMFLAVSAIAGSEAGLAELDMPPP